MESEIKTDFSDWFKKLMSWPKSNLVSSECLRSLSLLQTLNMISVIEDGRDANSSGSNFRISHAQVPGRQSVTVLKKKFTCLIMEPPTISVDGGNNGRGPVGRLPLEKLSTANVPRSMAAGCEIGASVEDGGRDGKEIPTRLKVRATESFLSKPLSVSSFNWMVQAGLSDSFV